MEKDRSVAVVFPSGVCNLQCRYCGIDKNPALKQIDDRLEESFKGNYYIERIKKFFPNKGQLKRLETWGGEPFLHMDRIYPLVNQIIEEYPYFSEFYSSTNFSYPFWTDQLFGLIDQFNKYPYRDFQFFLQLSCDGPEYINDAGRGKGTTKKCLENFKKLCNMVENKLGEHIELVITVKPTLDIKTLHLLDTKEKIIEYYKFFEENFIEPIAQLNFSNVKIIAPVPNTAVPTPVSKADGEFFAWFCKTTRQIEKENRKFHFLPHYNDITMFSKDDVYNPELTYQYNHYICGVGVTIVGFLPDNMQTACHEGFTNFAMDYKKLAAESKRLETGTIKFDECINEMPSRFCLTEDQYEEFERQMNFFEVQGTTARLACLANEICIMALAGQIEPRYKTYENALKAAIFVQNHCATCVKDNFNITGSIILQDNGTLKLFLNGALQYIAKEGDMKFDD